ncbi:MAG: twin-arginine translocase TatA/TatE family subunit [Anaerolineales bacterium]|nr:twin-arginine translocase TatA/TatE family subunit [Anaerolineales bacterium]
MEILGIGMSELIFIVIIALIVLGPKDMQKAGRTLGRFLRNIVTSDGWKMFQQTSRELRTLPNRLMRDANEELNQIGNELNDVSAPALRHPTPPDSAASRPNNPSSPLRSQPIPENLPENKIAPPTIETKADEGGQGKDD